MRQPARPLQYEYDFAIVNKSYLKDLEWSVVMYRSWCQFADPVTPFFVVVPHADLRAFHEAFDRDRLASRIDAGPTILSEESLFEITTVSLPSDFTGWHRQQLVKLCFSKSNFARQYATIDSNIIFTKRFDFNVLMNKGRIFTSAMPVEKDLFYRDLKAAGQKGWLEGRLIGIEECFEKICEVMENRSSRTNAYISCTGLFNSDIARDLEQFAISKGLDGYAGLLGIAPYEFAWYGEFVYSQHPDAFEAFGPHWMTLAESEYDAHNIVSGALTTYRDHFGVMFQPPASELCGPQQAYDILVGR